MVYVICTGVLSLLIAVAVVGQRVHQKLGKRELSSNQRVQQRVHNIQERHEIDDDFDNESVYDIIELVDL